jgi:hypothetical protein
MLAGLTLLLPIPEKRPCRAAKRRTGVSNATQYFQVNNNTQSGISKNKNTPDYLEQL